MKNYQKVTIFSQVGIKDGFLDEYPIKLSLIKSRINCLSCYHCVHLTPEGNKFRQNVFCAFDLLRLSRSMFIYNKREHFVCAYGASNLSNNHKQNNSRQRFLWTSTMDLPGSTEMSQHLMFLQHFLWDYQWENLLAVGQSMSGGV